MVSCAERRRPEIPVTPSTIPKSVKEPHEVGGISGCAQNRLGHRRYYLAFRNHLCDLCVFLTQTGTTQCSLKSSSNTLIEHHQSLRRNHAESVTISKRTSIGERFMDDSNRISTIFSLVVSRQRRRERREGDIYSVGLRTCRRLIAGLPTYSVWHIFRLFMESVKRIINHPGPPLPSIRQEITRWLAGIYRPESSELPLVGCFDRRELPSEMRP